MSYCVECGVKLEKASEKCPLCNTAVLNPNNNNLEKDNTIPAYANEVLVLDYRDRKDTTILINLVFLSLNIITISINLLFVESKVFWPIVLGSCVLISIIVSIPLLYREINPYIYLASIFIGIIILFFSISVAINSWKWVRNIAFPILLSVTFLIFVWLFIQRKFNKGIMFTIGLFTFMVGILCILIEGVINLETKGRFFSNSWSLIVLICGVTIALILLVISNNRSWREELRKRFHF